MTKGGWDLLAISESTPGWLAVLKFVWIWAANAGGSLVLWILAVPGSGGDPAFYRLGWLFVIGNAIGLLYTGVLFLAGKRAQAVQRAKWVIPVIFAGLLAYGVIAG